jgi:cytochrome c-type biogenesis protein CcmH/NrfG
MTAENRLVQPRHVILLVGLGLVLIFGTALIYRLTHPSLTMTPERGQPGRAEVEHGDEQDMTRIRELMVGLQEDPENIEIMKALGREFMQMRAWEQAKGFLQKAVMAKPSDVESLMMLGVALFNMERHKEAAEQFEMVLSLDEKNVMAKYNLGVIHKYGLNNPDKAREYFSEVVGSDKVSERIREQAAAELE